MKTLKINYCEECPHHQIIADTDPHDWFCDDDVAIVCKLTRNENQDKNSQYQSDRSCYKIIQCAMRPYLVKKIKIPDWCPL